MSKVVFLFCLLGICLWHTAAGHSQSLRLQGHVLDQKDLPVSNAIISLAAAKERILVRTDSAGSFALAAAAHRKYLLTVTAPGFLVLTKTVIADGEQDLTLRLAPLLARNESVLVTSKVADLDILSPDPSERVFVRQQLLDANPGRPGAPVSIPGYPIETASSGIKAPQYFAPGVAGDHGEPIAQYILVGSYLVPNNLSANAHGNGYADPNVYIPAVLDSVEIDGGAFNVREGNHAVNLAATYGVRSTLTPFLTLTGDYRDLDAIAGFHPSAKSMAAVEFSFGNGLLHRLEHRQQYKGNTERTMDRGNHEVTLMGIGYYGESFVPGLVPLGPPNSGDVGYPLVGQTGITDTLDPRQHDQTHTALLAINDIWTLHQGQQLQSGAFFRTYNLALFSNFGQGLIRQSEFRTVAGESADYTDKLDESLSLLAGFDYNREAPRRDNLDHYNDYTGSPAYGPFTKVDSNNITISGYTPYAAIEGTVAHHFRYYGGWRRDQIEVVNQDLLHTANSFDKWVGVNSPKATIAFIPDQLRILPLVTASFGESFFTEDPRIGMGSAAGTPVATAHSYQVVASKTLLGTDVKLTLGHTTTSAELAKIDPDTGLQFNEGPGRLRFLTLALQKNFSEGMLLATFSKADARDVNTGEPTPEAPRTIVDLLGSFQKLPLGLQARGEFEYVGAKPLGTGCLPDVNAECVGVPVKEFRAAVLRSFDDHRFDTGINALIGRGYTGQTTENFGSSLIQEIVGVRLPSYVGVSVTYHFGRQSQP